MNDNLCQVCEAPAEGNHFGVPACKACGAYFRRSIAEDKFYQCRRSGNCEVLLYKRNQCRACRLQKCFDVGMKKEENRMVTPPPAEVTTSPIFSKLNSAYRNFLDSQKSLFNLHNCTDFSSFLRIEEQFKMVTIEEHNTMEKLNASLILSLLNDNFPCFAQLTKEEKKHFFGPFALRFISLHRCYLTFKYFPNDDKKMVLHYGYYTQLDLEGTEHFYGDVPKKEQLLENILPAFYILKKTANKMVELDVTNEELGGLIALLYYSQLEQYPTLYTDIRKKTRAMVVSEFHSRIIEKYGIRDGGLRYTQILSLILDFENICTSFTHSLIIGNMYLKNDQEVMLIKDTFLDS